MLFVLARVHPIVLFHASEAVIDAVKRPDVQILDAAPKLAPLIEEVDGDASDGQLSVLLEDNIYTEGQSSLDWNLTVPQLSELDDLVEADCLRQVHFCGLDRRVLLAKQWVTPVIQGAVYAQLDWRVVAWRLLMFSKVPLQDFLVLLDRLILVSKVAEGAFDPRHELRDVLLASFPVVLPLLGISMLVEFLRNLEDLVLDV